MLNRRLLRIKVLQALYTFVVGGVGDLAKGEAHLNKSINRLHELFTWNAALLMGMKQIAEQHIDISRNKHLPTEKDLNPNLRFVENPILVALENDRELKTAINNYHVSWTNDQDITKKLFQEFKKTSEYEAYMNKPTCSFTDHRNIMVFLFHEILEPSPMIEDYFEEMDIHWSEDIYFIQMLIGRALESFNESNVSIMQPLFKDEDDHKFMINLFRKAVINYDKNRELIAVKAANWEIDRIAVVDYMLMNLAIVEFIEFPSIPIKVTLNEYIEISKGFSSPKSKSFINGILDKIVSEFVEQKLIKKTGRGLVE
ncbi:MAG: transcription antitermination factor NusB [Bacteroidetes bacterium]|nr:transcription antitermination factor NusB [Bacteroidota bacterium]MBU1720049.1 transcription antitermination factor NusB [Bacteroidota bacterium]